MSPSQAASARPGPPSDRGTTWSPATLESPARLELSQSELEQLQIIKVIIWIKTIVIVSLHLLDFDLSSSLPMNLAL